MLVRVYGTGLPPLGVPPSDLVQDRNPVEPAVHTVLRVHNGDVHPGVDVVVAVAVVLLFLLLLLRLGVRAVVVVVVVAVAVVAVVPTSRFLLFIHT